MTHDILVLTPAQAEEAFDDLCDLLVDAVESGGAVSFIQPMTRAKAEGFWRGVLDSHARGERLLLVAAAQGRIDGTVQVVLAPQENQSYRADIAKMLVHRRARRQGLGAALMAAAEAEALGRGRTLMTLDTETGSAGERLYTRCGWIKYGEIPDFAWNADGVHRDSASFFYKVLG